MDLPVLTTPGNKPNCPACFGSVFGRVGIAAVCHKCGHHFHANCLPDVKCSNCKAPNTLDYFGVQGFFDGKAQIITFGVNKTVATIDEMEHVSNQFYEEAARSTRCANLLFPKKDKMKQGHEMMDSFLTSPQLNKATLPSLPPSPELDRKPAAKPVAPKKKVLVRTPATSHNWNMLRNGRVPVNYKESSSSGSSNDTSKDTTSKKRTTSMMEDMDYQPSLIQVQVQMMLLLTGRRGALTCLVTALVKRKKMMIFLAWSLDHPSKSRGLMMFQPLSLLMLLLWRLWRVSVSVMMKILRVRESGCLMLLIESN